MTAKLSNDKTLIFPDKKDYLDELVLAFKEQHDQLPTNLLIPREMIPEECKPTMTAEYDGITIPIFEIEGELC